jgi:hypothetical protein
VSRVRGIRSRTNKVPPNKAVGWRCRTTAQCHQTVADRWAIARDRRSFAEGRRSGKPLERVPIGKSWLRLDLNELTVPSDIGKVSTTIAQVIRVSAINPAKSKKRFHWILPFPRRRTN